MNTDPKKISNLSKILLFVCAGLLTYSIFVPLWRIDLDAPQYPEGLRLLIYPNRLGGNVEIINGLNHYIGMRELHSDDFVEFTVLPYIVGAFALACLVMGLRGRKRGLYVLLATFVVFGVVAMVDFYKWEYEYGHDLSPHAAIIVPGQAYQPPLIGFKQLLNFGAYSIPAVGGWMFIASGILMVLATLIEKNVFKRSERATAPATALVLGVMLLTGCGEKRPEPIQLNKDNCAYCKMTISDPRFGAQLITGKGRVYKFDDLSCLKTWEEENQPENPRHYVANYLNTEQFLAVEEAVYVSAPQVNSPMGGNLAAFRQRDDAVAYATRIGGEVLDWAAIAK